MKYSLFVMIILFASVTGVEANNNHAPNALVALSKKLASLHTISYNYSWEAKYPSMDYHDLFEGTSYIEFNETDKQTVSRFRMVCDKWIHVYNGSEVFFLKKDKTYELRIQPKQQSFAFETFFINSIPTLRSVIQQWVQDDNIPKYERDTVIENRSYTLVQLDIKKYLVLYLNYIGTRKPVPDNETFYYKIIIDKKTGLPYQVVQTNNMDSSISKTVFTHFNTKPKAPEADSWNYTTYQNEYTPEKAEGVPLIAPGTTMPEWSLTEYKDKDSSVFKSNELKGKLIMMDFWIKNCGACMSSFPELKRLQKLYGGDNFQLVSVNAWDRKEQVAFFYKKEDPKYKFLYNGEALAKAWGVHSRGYPTVVLVDKTGKVIYAEVFDYGKVERLIKANL